MKVFKMNDCDWVAAETMKEAAEWYIKNYDEYYEKDGNFPLECDIEKDGMWFGWNCLEYLSKFLKYNGGKEYKCRTDRTGNFEIVLWLTFKEVFFIDISGNKMPYIIATTEF
jgi:hypothetical protein